MEARRRLTIFLGGFGSGKTEVAVNFAFSLAAGGRRVRLADLDLMKPLFRCREIRGVIEAAGVSLVSPEGFDQLDLPILLPEVKSLLLDDGSLGVMDVGGDAAGTKILASLSTHLDDGAFDFLFVVNMKRPFTDTVETCVRMMRDVEEAGRIRVTGLVSNTHLMDETTPALVLDGYRFAEAVAGRVSVPVAFVSVEERLAALLDPAAFDCPIFPMRRYFLPPWRRSGEIAAEAAPQDHKLGPSNFRLACVK